MRLVRHISYKNFLFFSLLLLILFSCAKVPITGRNQLTLIPDYQLISMSEKAYRDFLEKHKQCPPNSSGSRMVQRVGTRISRAVERFMYETGQSDRIRGFQWEFHLVCDKKINAWCMPGGKVVVYKGILPVAKNETGLAVVLGHEIAHAIANHASERMSQQLLLQLGGEVLSIATGSTNPATRRLLFQLYGLGANVGVLLPYSRIQEYEADHLGLIFMAIAGYDPRQAIAFWERMAKAGKNKPRPPEFLSTHPSDTSRIQKIRQYIPEAMRYYNRYLQEQGYSNKRNNNYYQNNYYNYHYRNYYKRY